jgi:hypothetical protein
LFTNQTKITKRLKEKRELKNKIYSRKHAEKNQAKQLLQMAVIGGFSFHDSNAL